jgi:hypothetical protein
MNLGFLYTMIIFALTIVHFNQIFEDLELCHQAMMFLLGIDPNSLTW